MFPYGTCMIAASSLGCSVITKLRHVVLSAEATIVISILKTIQMYVCVYQISNLWVTFAKNWKQSFGIAVSSILTVLEITHNKISRFDIKAFTSYRTATPRVSTQSNGSFAPSVVTRRKRRFIERRRLSHHDLHARNLSTSMMQSRPAVRMTASGNACTVWWSAGAPLSNAACTCIVERSNHIMHALHYKAMYKWYTNGWIKKEFKECKFSNVMDGNPMCRLEKHEKWN